MNQEAINSIHVPKKKFLTKKKIIWTVLILLAVGGIGYQVFKSKNPAESIVVESVKKQDIKQTVLATGQVVSGTDLSLSFKAGGVVQRVSVREGDKVKMGAVLAYLSQSDQLASLTSARGSMAQAQANYAKVLAGASNEDVAVTQVTLDNAKISLQNIKLQQRVLVENAYSALLNTGLEAIPGTGNTASVTATVTGTYTGKEQGMYKISVYSTGAGLRYQVSGLETGDGKVDTTPQPIGTKGLYIQFNSTSFSANNTWTVSIPNTQASSYISSYNAYQSALQTQSSSIASAENAVSSAQAALDLKKAQARPADVQAAQAQILSAQGQLLSAQAAFENTLIKAPANGTITSVDVKVGEQASGLKEVMILQDVGNLHVEANISEANIASLKTGQTVDLTFDALGPDRHFKGVVQTVNPASTVVSGVVNYKVVASMDSVTEVKPGMTANMSVLIDEKLAVLTVPQRSVINQNGRQYVRVIDDSKKKSYHQVEVTAGLEGDGGLVQIVSGLNEGQEIVTFIKQ